MGFFTATDVSADSIQSEYGPLLVEGERVLIAFKTMRDVAFLTNRRFCFVDKQGLTGKKREVQTIPYRSIVRFSFETAGTFDLDAELKLWLAGTAMPLELKIGRDSDPAAIQRVLALGVFGMGH